MIIGELITLLRGRIYQVLLMASPLLLSALTVGLVVAILQAATSIQEQTLTFATKVVVIILMLAAFGGFSQYPLGYL